MPTYDYFCKDCGDFAAMRPIAERNDFCACPVCGGSSYRVMVSAPQLGLMEASSRMAYQRNERAANVPISSSELRATHKHGPGCGCGSKLPSATVRAKDGAKAFPSKRPWMISH